MDVEAFRNYCIQKDHVTEGFPFNQSTLVFKVANKMFALADIDVFEFINLKTDPEKSTELRENYDGIRPGYHMNKKLWNSVYVSMDVDDKLLYSLIDDSYNEVISTLSKKRRTELSL